MVRKKKKWFLTISLRKKRKKYNKWKLKIFIAIFSLFVIIPSVIGYMWFKKNILDKLPPISKIDNIIFSQTTTITDRNWVVLYKVFEENRKYVTFDQISDNMKNAIIAMEDKNFWNNPGIDIQWIIRAAIHDIIFWKKQWASTLTQQLIKNLILTRERTITRKLKEIVLAIKLNNYLKNKIENQYGNLDEEQVKQKVKEKILEMYLNYVFLWNNSYWVEAAANTYFHKKASNLTVLESAILASIPKSPVKYDPFNNRDNNLWKLEIYNLSWEKVELTWNLKKSIESTYIDYLKDQSFSLATSEKEIVDMLSPKNLKYKDYSIKFIPWRSQFVLARMYLDGYINKSQLIKAMQESLSKEIYPAKVEIKAPWFVFFTLNSLYKNYWKDVITKAWWTIKTSLDWKTQQLAENAIKNNAKYLESKWANNSALLYIDTTNWDILAYVWSKDYYNKDIDWQVDMITSLRQCGSVIKPLIYANAFIKNKNFTPDTPIYDTYFKIAWKWRTFNNFDGRFLWLLPMKKALAYSRNIPAAKMYFLWWWEYPVKEFLRKIWLKTISEKIYYGYPLSIWAAEVTMLDMAQAYSFLSNQNQPVKINPILEIRWPDWNLIYKKTTEKLPKIIPTWVISFLWYILSNPQNRPPSWNNIMQVVWLTLATKSWTTNIFDKKTHRKLPRDWWFISYTPSKVFVAWAWNTNWKPMNPDAYWGRTAWKVWREFVISLKNNQLIKNETMTLKDTTSTYINTLNWRKASEKTPVQVSQKTIARLNWIPQPDDWENVKMIKIDKLCNWLVSKYTPKKDITYWYVIKLHSLKPSNPIWENPVQKWWKETWIKKYKEVFNAPVFLEEPTNICEDRKVFAEKWMLKFNINWPKNNTTLAYVFDMRLENINAPFPLKHINIYVDWKKVITYNYSSPLFSVVLPFSIAPGYHKLTVELVDNKGYSISNDLNIILVKQDKDKPFLEKIKHNHGKYIYIFKDNTSKVVWGTLICNWERKKFTSPIAIWTTDNCSYEIMDYYGNTAVKK